mmetsp:Transcript_11236/g.21921  ORF Transcript_11236/g.21921 Transcript_11236/m.21921 type:complete len:406 (-) Transcript_11236:244-1461(-)
MLHGKEYLAHACETSCNECVAKVTLGASKARHLALEASLDGINLNAVSLGSTRCVALDVLDLVRVHVDALVGINEAGLLAGQVRLEGKTTASIADGSTEQSTVNVVSIANSVVKALENHNGTTFTRGETLTVLVKRVRDAVSRYRHGLESGESGENEKGLREASCTSEHDISSTGNEVVLGEAKDVKGGGTGSIDRVVKRTEVELFCYEGCRVHKDAAVTSLGVLRLLTLGPLGGILEDASAEFLFDVVLVHIEEFALEVVHGKGQASAHNTAPCRVGDRCLGESLLGELKEKLVFVIDGVIDAAVVLVAKGICKFATLCFEVLGSLVGSEAFIANLSPCSLTAHDYFPELFLVFAARVLHGHAHHGNALLVVHFVSSAHILARGHLFAFLLLLTVNKKKSLRVT